jgi:hypothetical protein
MSASARQELDASMNRFNQTETAVIARLHALKAKPEVTITLQDINDPLGGLGFTKDEISAVLVAFEQDKTIAFASANRILVLKSLF